MMHYVQRDGTTCCGDSAAAPTCRTDLAASRAHIALLLLHLCLERGQLGMDFCPRVLRRANPEPYQLAAWATMKPGHRYPDVSADLCERALQPSDADGVVVATPREKVVDQVPPFFQKRELFVKRVTALPGDRVDVDRQGTVTIAGFYSGGRGQGLSSR